MTSSPHPPSAYEGERLSKRVMQLKGCSRSEAERYIADGWVRVDGAVVEAPQHRVTAQHAVSVDPQATLQSPSPVTLVLHKPAGERAPRPLLQAARHWEHDPSQKPVLQRHFQQLESAVPLEDAASGLVVFTQDWRVQRKLVEDMAFMEHELMVEVAGEVNAEALEPLHRALLDTRRPLPSAKVSLNSNTLERSRLRFAIKGAHPGLVAYLCDLVGLQILSMRRIRLGRVALGELPAGQWRYLAPHEKF